MKKNFIQIFTFALILFSALTVTAQTGTIAGKVLDTKLSDVVIGATIKLNNSALGAASDLDGNFRIQNVPVGTHQVTVTYVGFTTKNISDIVVKANETTNVDIPMEESTSQVISEVVVTATAKKSGQTALTLLQKNSITVADGISSETIRRTPDRTTGEVIRRVSGATIQDNKFAIIRGLSDRYNVAMLNGGLLPSTEPDRRAFSFDLFPSNMLDNLMIVKTASADLPGEFAGGAILLTTKDIPDQNFVQANLSSGYNTNTTGRNYIGTQGGSTDWLGVDDGSRALPTGFPSSSDFKNATRNEKIDYSQQFSNDWGIKNYDAARPNSGFQISAGLTSKKLEKVQLGSTLALSYNNSNRLQTAIRQDFDFATKLFEYKDVQFRNNVLWGAMLNSAAKINNRQKLFLQASYTVNTDNTVNSREGKDFEQVRDVRASSAEYTASNLITTRVGGEHALGASNYRLEWGLGYNRTNRDVPSLRRMFSVRNFDDEATAPFRAFVPYGSADPYRSGRFYSTLHENTLNGNVDFTFPFAIKSHKQNLKIGLLAQQKDRDFDARVMGFIRGTIAGFNTSLLELPADQIFAKENIHTNGFVMDEITNPSDTYIAGSTLGAAYFVFDNKIAEKFRLSWGVRMEQFNQKLDAIDYTNAPVNIDRTSVNWLPSLNFTWLANEKHQLRFSASKTVSRPEFRELAPFSFYDFNLNGSVTGNPELKQADILNIDLRYEWFPGKNQMFSTSLFYKDFTNPIEFTFNSAGAGTRTFNYQNLPGATLYGLEAEFRKNFEFIHPSLEDLVFFSNAAIIRSTLNLENVSAYDTDRAMQGQSPYIVNGGLSYQLRKLGLSTTVVYNVIGDRVWQVGQRDLYGDVYERHRNLIDFQIGKKLGERGEIKLNISDILNQDIMFYQDINANHSFDADVDNIMQKWNPGTTFSLSLGYKI